MDPESQLNAINYFDDFIGKNKEIIDADYGSKKLSKKQAK